MISMIIQRYLCVLVLFFVLHISITRADDAAKNDFFEKHIRPILISRCYECHSADSQSAEGELRLDSQPAMVRGGTRGNTIELKDGFEKSIFWQAITYDNSELQMPPTGKLPAEEIELLKQWLTDGAYDPRTMDTGATPTTETIDASQHWAYKRPMISPVQRDANDQWSRDVVDELVFSKLKSKNLAPNDEADDRTLVRRLYYDLTGLPPSFDEIEAYVASTSANRYEELVDRLIASPAFGERMARRWMDVVRYADTKGYVFQEEQRYKWAYQYRDWLINAFNSDMRFDEFVKYQIAADRLDPGNENGNQAAMGMITLGRRFLNNPNDIADDRIDVVTRGTMAISVICARCHDHKYDPIDMADYYSLHSAFVNSHEPNAESAPLALVDKDQVNPAFIMKRGNPHQRGDQIDKRFVKFISLSKDYPLNQGSGRLDLAEAIVDPLNPLTARTIVNRMWTWLTNTPIVSTPSDFGVRCPPPLHQDVLDRLACDFQNEGWSIKSLARRIVLTSTYRLSSQDNNEKYSIDPTNDYWWRANRRRSDFESLRDAMLTTTQHQDLSIGGDSVRIFNKPYPGRRTIYAYIDRLDLPGVFRSFDFANPDQHVPQRSLTTVPQQGLFLLNNEFVIYLADSYARSLESRFSGETQQDAMLASLYQDVLLRKPTEEELRLMKAYLQQAEVQFPEKERSQWSYGYGAWDGEPRTLTSFVNLPVFSEERWMGGSKLPDDKLGWCSLTKTGGHPDQTKTRAAVRRWTAPRAGSIAIRGNLKHTTDQGDGVDLFVALNTSQVGQVYHAQNNEQTIELNEIAVQANDTIDLVVDSGATISHDSFEMRARIRYADESMERFISDKEFAGPPPAPLTKLGQLVQALLASNEFTFID